MLDKITFIIPPSPFLIDDLVFPNLGVLYLSSVLKAHSYKVSVIDLHGHANNWMTELMRHDLSDHIIGITAVTPEFPIAVEIMKTIKSNIGGRIIIGGPAATCDVQRCLLSGFDAVIAGEGEGAILKVMEGSERGVFREDRIENLDEIPFPDRSAIDLKRYHYEIDGKNATNMITSRGCYYSKCRFCCQVWGQTVRFRSADNVIAELNQIHDMGYDGVMLADDEFFFKKERDFEICKALKDLDMSYRCLTRSDLLNDEVVKVAAKTGLGEMLLGIETGSRKISRNINKGMTIEQHKNAIKLCKEHGIRVKALFMVGLPGESKDTIEETKRFIEETKPDTCEFTIYTPYPKSEFWNEPYLYDIGFDTNGILNSGGWYKGIKGNYVSHVRTSSLSAQEIIEIREEMEKCYAKSV